MNSFKTLMKLFVNKDDIINIINEGNGVLFSIKIFDEDGDDNSGTILNIILQNLAILFEKINRFNPIVAEKLSVNFFKYMNTYNLHTEIYGTETINRLNYMTIDIIVNPLELTRKF